MTSVIYSIQHIVSGKRYVGSACNCANRWSKHRLLLRENRHHSPKLQNAWNKYGSEAFEWLVLEEVLMDDLITREQYWIDTYDCVNNGYNVNAIAGSSRGTKRGSVSPEVRINMANAQFGKTHTEETKRKISIGNIGKVMTAEQVEKYRKSRHENALKRLKHNPFAKD